MAAKRKRHKPEFKAQVALKAYKGDKTINQLASEHEVASVQVSQWKRQLLQGVPEIFGRTRAEVDQDVLTAPCSVLTIKGVQPTNSLHKS